jgi:hypothetical protein
VPAEGGEHALRRDLNGLGAERLGAKRLGAKRAASP